MSKDVLLIECERGNFHHVNDTSESKEMSIQFCADMKDALIELSTLTAKVTELEKDRERLEWMIENKERIAQRGDEYFLFYSGNHPSKTPREAIDAAMKESEKK